MLFSVWNQISAIGIENDNVERLVERVKLTNELPRCRVSRNPFD